jgi:gas vesicle protein
MSRHDVEEEEIQDDQGGHFAWFVAGIIVGAAVGLLYAPKAGRETREFLNRKTHEGRQAVSDTGKDVYDRSRDFYEKGRQLVDDAAELFDRGRKLVRG